jgi:SAM-dependent methyltransferase
MPMYQRLCTEFYDLDKPDEPKALPFYLKYAERAEGPIFEPMCGSGRFLVPLLARGFDIDGSDASPFMLEACRQRAEKHRLKANISRQNLEETTLPRRYGLVIIPSASFGLLTDPVKVREALRGLWEAMLPKAKLVLEIERPMLKESASWPWGGRWLERPDGATLVVSWLGHYDAAKRINYNLHRYELFKDGRLLQTELEHFDLQLYEPDDFQALLESSGFCDVQRLEAHAFRPPDEGDETIVFECMKP